LREEESFVGEEEVYAPDSEYIFVERL